MPLIKQCICGRRAFDQKSINGIRVLACACGVQHQDVDITDKELSEWYASQYHKGTYYHSYDHDYAVAINRIARYAGKLTTPILDIGCGNGAFRDACNASGFTAYGQDLGGGAADYKKPVFSVSETFNTVTMHDVLEHFVDPVAAINKVYGLLREGGGFILDFPAFHLREGEHHWKPVEHLWMFNTEQVIAILREAGFIVEMADFPVASKIVFYSRKATNG